MLLDILGGLDVPTAGEVVYKDHDPSSDANARAAKTGGAAFDAPFEIRTSDEPAMRQLLAEEARAELLAMDAWCK